MGGGNLNLLSNIPRRLHSFLRCRSPVSCTVALMERRLIVIFYCGIVVSFLVMSSRATRDPVLRDKVHGQEVLDVRKALALHFLHGRFIPSPWSFMHD
jgi:hypothetical protein